MLLSEIIRVTLFVGGVVGVYVSAFVLVIRRARRRVRADVPAATRREIWVRRTIFTLAAFGLLCIGYGYFVEPYWLEVTHVHVESAKLPRGARPIRIVHISDVHSEAKPRLEERAAEVIAGERPDVITYVGDSINSRRGLPRFQQMMRRLAAIAPTFAVRGNWDIESWRALDLFGNTGVRELDGEAVPVNVGAVQIWVVGVAWSETYGIEDALPRLPAGAFTVFLYHIPDEILNVRNKVDLNLAGHTHRGQVALPLYGALMTSSKFGKRFEAGLYHVDETWLYVNRGIGMEGGFAPRVRFCARTEVTVIDVSPKY
jgi:predicted MPP superfamily phosphohydrolase